MAWLVSGCTLATDPFEPLPLDLAQIEDSPVASGLLPTAADSPLGNMSGASPVGADVDERGVIPGRRDPAEPNGGQLGSSSPETEPGDVSPSDAGAEPTAPSPEPPDAGAAPPLGATCPAQTFGASCYEFFDELASWDVAEQRCVDWGGHLASVGSPEEEGFLEDWPSALGRVNGDGSSIWLGGTDAALDGDFRWWDDSALVFDNWAPNQPDNGAGVDCVAKRNDGTGNWYDQRCTDGQPYVCERPL